MKAETKKIKTKKEIVIEPEVLEKESINIQGDKQYKINLSSVISILAIFFITGYIIFDLFVFNPTIKSKVNEVDKKMDSLELYLGTKIPQIDNALKIQEEQVKNLQDLSSNFIN